VAARPHEGEVWPCDAEPGSPGYRKGQSVTNAGCRNGVHRRRRGALAGLAMTAAALSLSGSCDAFNPAFVDLVAPGLGGSFSTLNNAPGHVVISFVNNAEVDERLIGFLETSGGLTLTDAEKRALRPRVRFLVRVTYSTGISAEFEFVSGSVNFIDQRFDASVFPDLNQNDLNNVVVVCDLAAVEVLTSSIEVFVPVELRAYDLVDVAGPGGVPTQEFQLREQIPPQFRTLQIDQADAGGNVVLLSNIGLRDVPAPVLSPLCGSVVAITMTGALRVPFLETVDDRPSFDRQDAATVASIGGRYEFEVAIK